MYDLNLSVPNITAEKYSTDNRFLLLKNYLYELNETLSCALGDKSQAEIEAVKKEIEEGNNQEKESIIRLNSQSKKRFKKLKEQIITTTEEILAQVEEYASYTAQGITEGFSESLADMNEDLSNLGGELSLLGVYIRTGELEEGVSGIEIGRLNSDIKARFINDRISFLHGHSEVAYISGDKLCITRAQIFDCLKIGNTTDGYFTFSTSENGLEVMWSDGN